MSRSDGPKKIRNARGKGGNGALSGDYEVGHGKPPVNSRWRKGQSGNPYGRPRKTDKAPFAGLMNPVRDMILEELARPVTITEGGSALEINTLCAVIRSTNVGAIRGNRFQQKLVLQYANGAEESRQSELSERFMTVDRYKERWDPIFEFAIKNGGPEPSQLPHPDHVDIDPVSGEILLFGPHERSSKKIWDHQKFQLRETEKMLMDALSASVANPQDEHEKIKVSEMRKHMARLEKGVPHGWNWREELGWETVYQERFYAKNRLESIPLKSVLSGGL